LTDILHLYNKLSHFSL